MPTWDERIDDAARELTEGSPSAHLKARVVAAIQEPAPRWGQRRAWMFAPAAAALALAAIVLLRNESAAPPSGTSSGVAIEPTAPPLSSGGGSSDVRLKPDATAEVRPESDATKGVRVERDATIEVRLTPDATIVIGTDDPSLDVAAPAPLAIAALTMKRLEVEELPAQNPLSLDELSLEPMRSIRRPTTNVK